jgi:formiminotetrahydrofolate cyclodeaminase
MLRMKTLNDFLDDVASSSPVPGGGSVAALCGALGAALTSMVCRLTLGKKKYADVQQEMEATLKRSEELRALFSELVEEDAAAFDAVMKSLAMPKESDEEKRARNAALQQATKKAALVPLKVMEFCGETLPLTKIIAEKGNVNSISDAGVAALALRAACSGAALNVQINLAALEDHSFVETTQAKMAQRRARVERLSAEILAFINTKLS